MCESICWLAQVHLSTKIQNKTASSSSRVFTHIDLSELGEGGPQYGWNSQHAVLHVGQPTHAVIHDHVGRVQVTVKDAAVVKEPQALGVRAASERAGGRANRQRQNGEHKTQVWREKFPTSDLQQGYKK